MFTVSLETRSLLTDDGVRLDADVYFPQSQGEFPVLLMRQPYGRAIASTVVYAHPQWYAQQGYIVVIQDVRGCGSSEGEFEPFTQEAADGLVTVNWAASLPGSTGAVGMYGFSYQGLTQLYAAQGQPEALKTLCPAMLASDLCGEWAYEGEAFCLQNNLAWAIQLAAETAKRSGDREAYTALFHASRQLPLEQVHSPGVPDVLKQYAPKSFYWDWLTHQNPQDTYWQHLNPDRSCLDLPMLHIGGWFDPYLRGTIRLYQDLQRRSTFPQHLWIGPWAHLPWGQQVGAVNYGTAAQTPLDRLQIRWFDHFLKGQDTGLLEEDSVHCFDLGTRCWWSGVAFPAFSPEYPSRTWKLTSTGLAALRTDDGKLVDSTQNSPPAIDTLVQDPWRPVPALGGHGAIPAGSFNRQPLDDRSDVLTYTTAPFVNPLQILGEVGLRLWISSPNPSFDLCAILSIVQEQGVFNFSQGYLRVTDATDHSKYRPSPLDLPIELPTPCDNFCDNSCDNSGKRLPTGKMFYLTLQPTCRTIAPGEALRLSISAACFPAYALNPGTGADPHSTPRWDAQVITLHLHTEYSSLLTASTAGSIIIMAFHGKRKN